MSIVRDIYDGPGRNHRKEYNDKKYIVIHNTSNDASAENEASYAKRRTDGVSSHYYVDSNSIVQSLDTDWRAQHVGSDEGNDHGISYEITGTNSKSRSWWLGNVAWDKLRKQLQYDSAEHNIALRPLTISQIREGKLTGVITHDQARQAWGHTTHTDPGPNFPMDMLFGKTPPPSNPKPPTTPNEGWFESLMSDLPELSKGSKGLYVNRHQALLNIAGARLVEDGDFGPATERETKEFQRKYGLEPDGIVGPKTWTKDLTWK